MSEFDLASMSSSSNPTRSPAPSSQEHEMTVIGQDTRIKGEMYFDQSARILGGFEGKIIAKGEVQVAHSAECAAAIEASTVHVDGTVHGPITAQERVTLSPNARVSGDITAGALIVAEGASFVGSCRVGPHAGEIAKRSGETPAQSQVEFKPPWKQREAAASSNGSATSAA